MTLLGDNTTKNESNNMVNLQECALEITVQKTNGHPTTTTQVRNQRNGTGFPLHQKYGTRRNSNDGTRRLSNSSGTRRLSNSSGHSSSGHSRSGFSNSGHSRSGHSGVSGRRHSDTSISEGSHHNYRSIRRNSSDHRPRKFQPQSRHRSRPAGVTFAPTSPTAIALKRRESEQDTQSKCSSLDNASTSSPSISGFSTYTSDTGYHTVCESSMAKIFGSAKVQFHGREKELKVLREIYAEVCRRDHPKQAKQSQPEETPQDAGANGDNDNVPGGEPNDKEATREKQRRSVAFVSGISGTGKSALIREFVQNLSTTTGVPGPLFLTGKFDELAGADPFSAIVEAFGGLATMLLDDGEMLENTTDYTEDLIRIQRDVKRYLRKEDM